MTTDMSQFYEVFFDEAGELLAEAEKLLLALDVADPANEDLHAIFRVAHSIKGGAATFGFTDMTEITHVLESLLDKIRQHEMPLTVEHVDAFLAAKDVLEMELGGHQFGSAVDKTRVEEIKGMLAALTQENAPVLPPAPSVQVASVQAESVIQQPESVTQAAPESSALLQFHILLPQMKAGDASNLEEELGLLGEVSAVAQADGRVLLILHTDSSRSDIISICSFVLDPDELVITETSTEIQAGQKERPERVSDDDKSVEAAAVQEHEETEESYGFFTPFSPHPEAPQTARSDDDSAIAGELPARAAMSASKPEVGAPAGHTPRNAGRRESDKGRAHAETTSIRVGVEKVDQLINLVGELVITQAMIEQRVAALDPVHHEALVDSVGQLTRNTRDLQESVMSIRMMPMDFVFSRFPRLVRDLAGRLEKKVELVTMGATTELDKGLIERIVDPLTHLVRNSIDHGIELPAARQAAGKTEVGRITLSAAHKGGSIVIEVTDDGAGLDREKLLAKARKNGMNVSDGMTDGEVFQLILAPGFSTAATVTDVSGRGVGMDVVKRNIVAMNGSIDIRSALGYGTTITISLPLTLAILDGMSVGLGSSVYVIPLNLIVETLQPQPQDIKTVTGEGHMVHVRGEYLPIIALHELFGQEAGVTDPTEGVLVLIEADGRKSALFVDRLVGQQQVVIKSLETNYRKVAGVSGATIMGDGSVALILDVPALIQMGQSRNYITGARAFSSHAPTINGELTQ